MPSLRPTRRCAYKTAAPPPPAAMRLPLLIFGWLLSGAQSAEGGMCCIGAYSSNVIRANAPCPAAVQVAQMNASNEYRQCDAGQLCCVSRCAGSGVIPSVGSMPPDVYGSRCVQNQSEWARSMTEANTMYRVKNSYPIVTPRRAAPWMRALLISAF